MYVCYSQLSDISLQTLKHNYGEWLCSIIQIPFRTSQSVWIIWVTEVGQIHINAKSMLIKIKTYTVWKKKNLCPCILPITTLTLSCLLLNIWHLLTAPRIGSLWSSHTLCVHTGGKLLLCKTDTMRYHIT